jgi:hypothetical protein
MAHVASGMAWSVFKKDGLDTRFKKPKIERRATCAAEFLIAA